MFDVFGAGSATDFQPAMPPMTLTGLTSPVAVSTPPSSSDASSPAHPPSTTNNDFLLAFKCHGDCSFEERIFQQTYDNRVNGPRRHCYPADTATSQHSVHCRLLHPRRHSRTQSFPSTHGAATTGKSCSTGSLSVAGAIDESHVATFQPPYEGHGEQQSETAQRAGLPASKPFSTPRPRCVQHAAISQRQHTLASIKYQRRQCIFQSKAFSEYNE
ncbi:uncharacterized protein ARMOST_20767 [Armillaria ostoyae]|uniref:Uncharacterized protein n=1 Tax=Armillaria ostoyae TaxID=47428 RepID=A0A284S880_ARMOS|nr:uncharacterized protein ARMOST_20767 [Armillaria ostoyae]